MRGRLPDPAPALLSLIGIRKRYGGVQALAGVDFDLRAGEVHVLLAENGAGISTLTGVMSGVVVADQGTIAIDGRAVAFASPRDAQAAGVAMIPQELDLIPGLDIAANLYLGREATRGPLLDGARMRRGAQALLARAGVRLDASTSVARPRMGERQLVVIAKALAADARVLIMDEPTAALSAAEAEHLFGVVRELSARGVGVVYISHRLEEVARIASRVTVMRDGVVVGTAAPDAPQAVLVRLLVGRDAADLFPPRAFAALGERLGGVFPVATLIFLVLAVIATLALNGTRYGRYVFAVGGNERAARLSGIRIEVVRVSVYALTGFASAVAGIMHAGQFSFGSPNDGTGYELNAIAAVVIGGTDLFGGAGSMVGTIAGAVMLGALANILQLNDVSAAMQLLATGAIIVLAAGLQTYVVGRGGR